LFSDEKTQTFITEKTVLQYLLAELASFKLSGETSLEQSQVYHELFDLLLKENADWEEGDLTQIVENCVRSDNEV
jgi:hypothetical protein